MKSPFARITMFAAAALLHAGAMAQSAAYPSRPVTLLVGYQAGGSVDLVARTIGPALAKRLGQPVVVENAAGAGGTIAAGKVAAATPDGHVLLLGSPSEVGINHLTNKKLAYHPVKDFAPIGLVGHQPMVLVTNPRQGASSLDDFISYASRNPGRAMYASAGVGTPLHLAGEMVKQKARVHVVHIPYRGAASMTTDLLGGQVEYGVFVLSSALPYVKDGRMRALGVTSALRSAAAPDIPALAEHPKLKGMDMNVWFGLLAPAATPQAVVERLRKDLRAVVDEPDVKKRLQDAGVELTPDVDFATHLSREIDKYAGIVDFAQISE
jgi:tripartite-type tricarboxylate transporter receptor subunit TctC